jgi:hypothetical protein
MFQRGAFSWSVAKCLFKSRLWGNMSVSYEAPQQLVAFSHAVGHCSRRLVTFGLYALDHHAMKLIVDIAQTLCRHVSIKV